MKCYSRSTLGVIIAILNILLYLGCSIVVIGLIKNDAFDLKSKTRTFHQREEAVAVSTILLSTILSVCILMVLLSGLLIMGIVKRRHQLMWPWLAVSGIGFVANCIRVLVSLVVGFVNGIPVPTLLILLLVGVLGVGIQSLILWPIYTLCRDMGEKNKTAKPEQHMNGMNYNYLTAEAPPQYNYQVNSLPQKSLE